MTALTADEKQIVDLFRRLPPERKPQVILVLAGTDPDGWNKLQPQGEARLRQLAHDRGMNWDAMTDQQRQDCVEEMLDGNGP